MLTKTQALESLAIDAVDGEEVVREPSTGKSGTSGVIAVLSSNWFQGTKR